MKIPPNISANISIFSKKTVNIRARAGLCNRLRTIYPILYFCLLNKNSLNVFWPVNEECPDTFDAILDRPNGLNIVYYKKDLTGPIDYCYYDPPNCIMSEIKNNQYLELFRPNAGILTEANRLLSSIFNREYNSVHIRRTDYTPLAYHYNAFIEDSIFEKYIALSTYPIYLACDNQTIQQSILNKFQNKILIYDKIQSSNKLRQTSMFHAMIDILLCSQAKDFLGSGIVSSFSGLIDNLRNFGFNLSNI